MNNPMIILIGLAIAAVGTLVAVNVVLPMLSRAESQAVSSEVNTLAGALWEAQRQGVTKTQRGLTINVKHLLSGWRCNELVPTSTATGGCAAAATTSFDGSQGKQVFVLGTGHGSNGGFEVKFKEGSDDTCLSAAQFLYKMSSPFFVVADTTGGAAWDGVIADMVAVCADDHFWVALK